MMLEDGSYVRDYYKVPAHGGGRIRFCGRPGTIEDFQGQYLMVRMDDEPGFTIPLHPTWRVEYL